MSRSNPYKKKRRSAKRTLLMFSEGLDEKMFLKHLQSIYSRDSGVTITIKNGKGGNAINIVIDASNSPGDFDKRIVVLDNDKGNREMQLARQEATRRGIELVENTPCLEALLLSILNGGANYSSRQSSWCKKEFESKYLDAKKRADMDEYNRLFPKNLLDRQRTQLTDLNKYILIMTGT